MSTEIVTVKANAQDVSRAIENMHQILKEETPGTALMASLGMAFLLQKPDISLDELIKAIDHTSNWISFYLQSMDGIPKIEIN